MNLNKVTIVCTAFLFGLWITLPSFGSELHEPDPTFELTATFLPIDGGNLYIGNVDKEKKSFRLHLRHFGKHSEWIYYYANSSVFVNADGIEEPDNAVAYIEYPQYTSSVIGPTFRRAVVRILFSQRGGGNGFFKEAGHVIFQNCATNTFKAENWNCTGWEYLGRLAGLQ